MPYITPLYIALSALLLLGLALEVVALRRRLKIGLGDGGDRHMRRAIRIHANATENLPMALLVLAALEALGAPAWELHAVGIAIVGSRLLHRFGLRGSGGGSFGRWWGMAMMWSAMGIGALDAIRRLLIG